MSYATGRAWLARSVSKGRQARRVIEPLHPRDRALRLYLLVAALLVLPGLVTAFGWWSETQTPIGAALGKLDEALLPIAFGRTLRFWLGVAGATMMLLLLLYPLRKLFGLASWISVGGWFHFHLLFGLLGPVSILYHSYFGPGSTPATVALVTTLVVAASGIFGHYVHTRLSADLYGERQRASELLDMVAKEIGQFPAGPGRNQLIEDLGSFEERTRAQRASMAARLGLSRAIWRAERDLVSRAVWLIDSQGPPAGWSPDRCREGKRKVVGGLGGYFQRLKIAARRSMHERLARIWRVLHMPLFFITVIAGAIHVYKVWGVDGVPAVTASRLEEPAHGASAAPPGGDGGRGAAPVSASSAAGALSGREGELASASGSRAGGGGPVEIVAPVHRKVAIQHVPVPPPHGNPDTIGKLIEAAPPSLVSGPKLAMRRVTEDREAPGAAVGGLATGTRPSTAMAPSRRAATTLTTKSPGPARSVEAVPLPVIMGKATETALPVSTPEPVEALAGKVAQWDNSGRLDPAVVQRRLDALKNDANFDHGDTRFPLTGRHKKVACERCHQTTLKDTPRQCVDCHHKDDVHRGRRPNCESCHVTTNWATIRRRR